MKKTLERRSSLWDWPISKTTLKTLI
jgi:hypothetical protein